MITIRDFPKAVDERAEAFFPRSLLGKPVKTSTAAFVKRER